MILRRAVSAWTALALASTFTLRAHENGAKNPAPTKAQADLKLSEKKMAAAKKKLAAQGRYNCCVKPSCSLCARVNGSCNCAANVAKGLGACGECYGGWKAGRGAVKGIDKKSVKLLPAENQACPLHGETPAELKEATDALLRAKRTLVEEKRFFCCIRGGCDQCAHEADCPCGRDLAAAVPEYYKTAGVKPPPAASKGVCGDCLDGWHSGHGSYAGIALSDVNLAQMGAMDDSMGTRAANYASGTSLAPKTAPMEMLSRTAGSWNLMLHGNLFAVETQQTGLRGRDKFFSTNWVMPMASRRLGPGTLALHTMFSLEPATITNERYPEIFQDGETAYRIPIINGQHPHNFFMELAASYQIRLGEKTTLNFYGGPRGEPALGPTAYPHRLSASEDPIAPLSHHLQDSTHISNDVATVGLSYGPVTLEASGFHGREPGEQRWGLQGQAAIDSFAMRLSVAPTSRWTAQFSAGRIDGREATHPLRPTFRTTASVMYVRPLARGHWATSLIWGRNNDLPYTQTPNFNQFFQLSPAAFDTVGAPGGGAVGLADSLGDPDVVPKHLVRVPTRIPGQIYNSYLAESTVFFKNKHWIWGRVESVDKESILLYEEQLFVLLVDERRYARVQAYTGGYEYELPRRANWLSTGLGAQFTFYGTPDNLKPVYGDHPLGIQVFLKFRLAPAPR